MSRQPELSRQIIQVAAGILRDAEGRVLIADRSRADSMQDYWEFPGGKLAGGESAASALQRELVEELGIEIGAFNHLRRLLHEYPDFSVVIDFYLVTSWAGIPSGVEGQRIKWLHPAAMPSGMLLPADEPILEALQEM